MTVVTMLWQITMVHFSKEHRHVPGEVSGSSARCSVGGVCESSTALMIHSFCHCKTADRRR